MLGTNPGSSSGISSSRMSGTRPDGIDPNGTLGTGPGAMSLITLGMTSITRGIIASLLRTIGWSRPPVPAATPVSTT
jgi:hypothetical protein